MGRPAASPLVPVVRPMLAARVAPRGGITAFHTTKKLQLLPAGPRKYFPTKVRMVWYEGNRERVISIAGFMDNACKNRANGRPLIRSY